MADLLDGYELAAPLGVVAWDEMFEAPDRPRATYQALHATLSSPSAADFDKRAAARDRSFRDQGINFSLDGEYRPFPLDLVPTGEWRSHDPTNGSPVGERHVVVGWGRDDRDVAPLVGVYQGGGTEHVDVAVELRRLA